MVHDADGGIYTVRYEAVNAMLLNEFLKEHRRVTGQDATIAELKTEIANIVARLKEQDSTLQKISDRLELSEDGSLVASSRP